MNIRELAGQVRADFNQIVKPVKGTPLKTAGVSAAAAGLAMMLIGSFVGLSHPAAGRALVDVGAAFFLIPLFIGSILAAIDAIEAAKSREVEPPDALDVVKNDVAQEIERLAQIAAWAKAVAITLSIVSTILLLTAATGDLIQNSKGIAAGQLGGSLFGLAAAAALTSYILNKYSDQLKKSGQAVGIKEEAAPAGPIPRVPTAEELAAIKAKTEALLKARDEAVKAREARKAAAAARPPARADWQVLGCLGAQEGR